MNDSPAPLTRDEIGWSLMGVTLALKVLAQNPEVAHTTLDEDHDDTILGLVGAWNALEEHLAAIDERPRLTLADEGVTL